MIQGTIISLVRIYTKEVHKMKIIKYILTLSLMILAVLITPVKTVEADDETRIAVYFKEQYCGVCQALAGGVGDSYNEDEDYIKKLEDQGITVYQYTIDNVSEDAIEFTYTDDEGNEIIPKSPDLFNAFEESYGVKDAAVPIIYVGSTYYEGDIDIKKAVLNMEIYNESANDLNNVFVEEGSIWQSLTGIGGFFLVLGGGLLDGFNPCAIALLLLFISLLGFTDNKKTLFIVSLVYIITIFISYYIIGAFLYSKLLQYQQELTIVSQIISWFLFFLCFFLFIYNLYDYIQARNENYGNIKNQLPKWIQRMNKKIVQTFTNAMDPENKKGLFSVVVLTILLGLVLSLTELVCTGQVYIGILYGLTLLDSVYAYFLLLIYNLMFILPLMIIAFIAIRDNSTNSVSMWILDHMKNIKFANAMLFLIICLFFMSRINMFDFLFDPFRNLIENIRS